MVLFYFGTEDVLENVLYYGLRLKTCWYDNKDFYFFKFKIPQEDKDLLTERIKLGVDYING